MDEAQGTRPPQVIRPSMLSRADALGLIRTCAKTWCRPSPVSLTTTTWSRARAEERCLSGASFARCPCGPNDNSPITCEMFQGEDCL